MADVRTARWGPGFTLLAIIVLALNLRHVAAGLGAILSYVQDDFGFSASSAGILVTLPVLCFAIFGSISARLAHVVGIHRTALLALGLIAFGSTVRALTDLDAVFWLGTVLALVGSAIGNVILPPLVKLHFPRRQEQISAIFVAATVGSATAAAALTLPVTEATGSWRTALLIWCGLAIVCMMPWLVMARHDTTDPGDKAERRPHMPFKVIARSRLAWFMAVFFGMQSLHAYVVMGWFPTILIDLGNSPTTASVAFALTAAMGVPMSLLIPRLVLWAGNSSALALLFPGLTAAGWAGLYFLPTQAPWLWAVLLGLGSGAFAWAISLIPTRSRTVAGTAALSGFVQTIGYLVAAIGPLGIGVIHDLTGSWEVSLWSLIGLCVPFTLMGLLVVRGPFLEDTLPRLPADDR